MKHLSILLFLCISTATAWSMEQIRLPQLPASQTAMADSVFHYICRQAHYLIGKVRPYEGHTGMKLLTKSMHGEHGIRPNTGTIMGLSFLYRFGDYRAKEVGIGKEALLSDYIIPMMNYVVATYDSIPTDDGKCWQCQWQSAHWTYSLGKAAWYIGEDLPDTLRDRICRIVKAEARRFYTTVPPHRIQYDTASEENAWNSQIFHVATLLMPDDPDCPRWKELFARWVLSSYLSPQDLLTDKAYSGIKLNEFEGANIYDDYTLENHGIVHPDYMCAFILSLQTAIDYRMTGREVPDFLLFNIQPIYENLKWFSLPDGGMCYPSWQDWRLFRNPDWFINHIYMAVFAYDGDAIQHARNCLQCISLMQQRHPAGNIYGEDEYFFPSTQNDLILYLAQAWQALHYAQSLPDAYMPKRGVKHFTHGKILLNKSSSFVHSLSYGNKLMFMPTLNATDRLFDSYQGSGIGRIRLKGKTEFLQTTLKEIDIQHTADSYEVTMTIIHGDAIEARYHIKSGKKQLEVEETLTALRDCETECISTSEYGILNNSHWVYERGVRLLASKGEKREIPALSGKELDINGSRFSIDRLHVTLHRHTKHFRTHYTGTQKYNRARGTDVLSLNYLDTPLSIHQGEVISQLRYSMRIR